MGEKIMHGFPSREEALADFFAAWEPPAEATERAWTRPWGA